MVSFWDGRVEAADVDVDAVGIGARDVEGFHPAGFAKGVLRDAGVEGVAGEIVVAGEQTELRLRHDEMQEAGLGTDRAVAVLRDDRLGRFHFEGDGAAVAASLIEH